MNRLLSIIIVGATAATLATSLTWAAEGAGGTKSATNANSPKSADRDKGQARAQDRRSDAGADHNKQGAKHK